MEQKPPDEDKARMVIEITAHDGQISDVKAKGKKKDGSAAELTDFDTQPKLWEDLKGKDIISIETATIFHTNPCVYYLQRGVLKRVCW